MREITHDQTQLIRQLLHDAMLEEVAWDPSLATFVIRFNCLRRNSDSSELSDPVVEIALADVTSIATCYDSGSLETRPSQFEPPRLISEQDLMRWPFRSQEAVLWVNSDMARHALTSAQTEWLRGGQKTAQTTFCIIFDQWRDFGLPVIHVAIVIAGGAFAITSGGIPLALDDWERQFGAWWKQWKQHWDAKNHHEADSSAASAEFDSAIPAADEQPRELRNYKPPVEVPFELEPTDAPPAILEPVRAWFECQHQVDWQRLARADPGIDQSIEERARDLERWSAQDFGRWCYAREIDDRWVEGPRACVIVRGVEHCMPMDGDPAKNEEAVWTFALQWLDDHWTIRALSQGWPRFGSAKAKTDSQKRWLTRWSSGDVL